MAAMGEMRFGQIKQKWNIIVVKSAEKSELEAFPVEIFSGLRYIVSVKHLETIPNVYKLASPASAES